jgi:hypothetical protein
MFPNRIIARDLRFFRLKNITQVNKELYTVSKILDF